MSGGGDEYVEGLRAGWVIDSPGQVVMGVDDVLWGRLLGWYHKALHLVLRGLGVYQCEQGDAPVVIRVWCWHARGYG